MGERVLMVGQVYRRVKGPEMLCEIRKLNAPYAGWALCHMHDGAGRDYGLGPVPFDLLKGDGFRRQAMAPSPTGRRDRG